LFILIGTVAEEAFVGEYRQDLPRVGDHSVRRKAWLKC
jgi:hypothetical protein